MNIIAVTDENGGMMFNRRRQSRDRVLREKIMELASGGRLWMNAYSAEQFEETEDAGDICVSEDFLNEAGRGDFCFVENVPAADYEDAIEGIWLFRWNRSYPGDFFFDIDVTGEPWTLKGTGEFPGYSHEKISLEVYGREK